MSSRIRGSFTATSTPSGAKRRTTGLAPPRRSVVRRTSSSPAPNITGCPSSLKHRSHQRRPRRVPGVDQRAHGLDADQGNIHLRLQHGVGTIAERVEAAEHRRQLPARRVRVDDTPTLGARGSRQAASIASVLRTTTTSGHTPASASVPSRRPSSVPPGSTGSSNLGRPIRVEAPPPAQCPATPGSLVVRHGEAPAAAVSFDEEHRVAMFGEKAFNCRLVSYCW